MQQLDLTLDDHPEQAAELIEYDKRNASAERELLSYASTGKFLGVHPLTRRQMMQRSYEDEMREMKRTAPEKFLQTAANLEQNIRRIRSRLAHKLYKSDNERDAWQRNLENCEAKKEILQKII